MPYIARVVSGIRRRVQDTLVDHYTWESTPVPSLHTLTMRKLRYCAAEFGIAFTANERGLLRYRDKHKGQRCFVLGNGPSLSKCDLRPLASEVTFGVNGIYLNHAIMGFYPTYYLVEDVFVAEDRADEINSLRGPVKFFGNYLNYCLRDSEDVIWTNVCTNYRDYDDFPHFSTNAARMLWVGGTVSYLCLQMAYYMGFSEVYLVGFDHNYTVPADLIKDGVNWTSQSDDPNHFNPNYFGKGYRWHDPNVERMEKALLKARVYFEADHRRIRNATVGGRLEVFPRVEYEKLIRL